MEVLLALRAEDPVHRRRRQCSARCLPFVTSVPSIAVTAFPVVCRPCEYTRRAIENDVFNCEYVGRRMRRRGETA